MALADQRLRQTHYMEQVAATEVPAVEMSQAERDEKEAFRAALQQIIFEVCDANPQHLPRVALECFGSFQSGFASANSDMDLVIVLQDEERTPACFSLMEDDLPRALERKLLGLNFGARLLTRTRVPIIKIAEKPDETLLGVLREERKKWDDLPEEKKYPHLYPEEDVKEADAAVAKPTNEGAPPTEQGLDQATKNDDQTAAKVTATAESETHAEGAAKPDDRAQKQPRRDKAWTRERKSGPLDFPKDGIGIQCDINFFNPLGLHNTQMLRCYSLSDPRVRPIVLFVKAWAKQRKINSSYSGTLSSYGFVLMVLHYLVNIAQPPVLSNLQLPWRPNPATCTPHGANRTEVDGWTVDFWRNEAEIVQAVQSGQMSPNCESLGSLLVGFFYYYSSAGGYPQFHWMKDVLSLRINGGLQSKEEKGWTKAVTEEGEGKKVQHRYLFCIEDPFELSHNVARTVTHNGIVAIRDEFRRAKRILHTIGQGLNPQDGDLFATLLEETGEEDNSAQHQAPRPATGPQPHHPNSHGPGGSNVRSAHTQNGGHPQPQHPALPQHPRFAPDNPQFSPGIKDGNVGRTAHHHHHPAKSLDVSDNAAFPSLGGGGSTVTTGPTSKKSNMRGNTPNNNKSRHHPPVTRPPNKNLPPPVQPSGSTSAMASTSAGAQRNSAGNGNGNDDSNADDRHAETTAMGAAEAVLEGM